ncbi:hypothetical protein [Xanthomonas cannabis]|uniref:hypothetical protein n=1 Tax=Xanthomonas cannabis TaxID=1885674 RepID=UPI001111F8EB|nr:hypothetical protein [Xanthomonas cannabis]
MTNEEFYFEETAIPADYAYTASSRYVVEQREHGILVRVADEKHGEEGIYHDLDILNLLDKALIKDRTIWVSK